MPEYETPTRFEDELDESVERADKTPLQDMLSDIPLGDGVISTAMV